MQEKTETNLNLKKLERQLRNLYDVLYNQESNSEEDDDPLAGKKTISAYSRSPFDRKIAVKNNTQKYPAWKKPPHTKKSIRKKGKHSKEMIRMMGGTNDDRNMKYYTVGPMPHHTQQEFYDVSDQNMGMNYPQPVQHFYNSGSEGDR